MSCPTPEQLLAQLAGDGGKAAQAAAETHLQACGECGGALAGLLQDTVSVDRFLTSTPPESSGACPESEALAQWIEGGTVGEDDHLIAAHVFSCEACACAAAQVRLDVGLARTAGPAAPQSASSLPGCGGGGPKLPVVAQVAGALILLLVATGIVLPGLEHLASRQSPPSAATTLPLAGASAEWPIELEMEFRLKSASRSHSLSFPSRTGVQLSPDYEYAVRVHARRTGSFTLFRLDPDRRLSLLSQGVPNSVVSYGLKSNSAARFPPEPNWHPVQRTQGRRRIYAVFIEDQKRSGEVAAEWRRSASSGQYDGLVSRLDAMVVAGGCSIVGRPCVLTLEYEVF